MLQYDFFFISVRIEFYFKPLLPTAESTTYRNQLTGIVNGSGMTKAPTTNKLEISTQTDNAHVHTEANGHFTSGSTTITEANGHFTSSSTTITDQKPVSNFTVLWIESSNNSDMVTTESTIDLTSHITNDSTRNGNIAIEKRIRYHMTLSDSHDPPICINTIKKHWKLL